MASQVGGDLSKIETGPCKVTYKSVACGHTMGGVTFGVKPQLRERKVDEYGEHLADLIYQGDQVDCKAKFAEKTMQVVQTVYQFGSSISSSCWGIGKLPGTKGSSLAGALVLHPLDGSGTVDDVTFYKAVVSDVGEVQFGSVGNDRVFEATFKMLIDESKSDGQLIGKIGVATS